MPFVSFLSVYQSGEKRGREDDIYISLLLARLNDGGTDGFYRPYRPLLVRVIENDDEDEVWRLWGKIYENLISYQNFLIGGAKSDVIAYENISLW